MGGHIIARRAFGYEGAHLHVFDGHLLYSDLALQQSRYGLAVDIAGGYHLLHARGVGGVECILKALHHTYESHLGGVGDK